ncbi:MAG: type I methionyl aminopeptidase [Endomicrobiales bacterium]|nr:type I methionyl aminopeptidase [Endomicrobiales bacterium]
MRFSRISVRLSKKNSSNLSYEKEKGAGISEKQPIELKTVSEIRLMKEVAQAVPKILKKLQESLKPGISTKHLDDLAFKEIDRMGMKPAFLGYRGYPSSTCISINNELVHGIPKADRIIKEGDLVSIDIGVFHHGFYGDAAITCGVGEISAEAKRLIEITRQALDKAIEKVRPDNRLGDVSWAIQSFVEKSGYSVVRDYVGHGIGRKLHEDPQIPNFGEANTGIRLMPGMVLAIEPMVNAGDWKVKTLDDGWTVVTSDGRLCAHFEHMVAITEKGCEVLTRI